VHIGHRSHPLVDERQLRDVQKLLATFTPHQARQRSSDQGLDQGRPTRRR
jgi:hypothetical protein